ncbi:hypothetical protein [Streptomyces sp. CB03238]|uniref:hypothetical protein n=1 Tax=Streptomyces sp. CB03238 TaxID=1907777 RepID=UPI000A1044E8|nr:hypothetical protein [Streptomyces sp. CB03238]ORT55661.1 hypothetical protein BKD26_31685 [Streptomyces sp. CB03238]
MMLWQLVVAAYSDPLAEDRENILAWGAAELAHSRYGGELGGLPANAEDVIWIAWEEFGIRLDRTTATEALEERRRPISG